MYWDPTNDEEFDLATEKIVEYTGIDPIFLGTIIAAYAEKPHLDYVKEVHDLIYNAKWKEGTELYYAYFDQFEKDGLI